MTAKKYWEERHPLLSLLIFVAGIFYIVTLINFSVSGSSVSSENWSCLEWRNETVTNWDLGVLCVNSECSTIKEKYSQFVIYNTERMIVQDELQKLGLINETDVDKLWKEYTSCRASCEMNSIQTQQVCVREGLDCREELDRIKLVSWWFVDKDFVIDGKKPYREPNYLNEGFRSEYDLGDFIDATEDFNSTHFVFYVYEKINKTVCSQERPV